MALAELPLTPVLLPDGIELNYVRAGSGRYCNLMSGNLSEVCA